MPLTERIKFCTDEAIKARHNARRQLYWAGGLTIAGILGYNKYISPILCLEAVFFVWLYYKFKNIAKDWLEIADDWRILESVEDSVLDD